MGVVGLLVFTFTVVFEDGDDDDDADDGDDGDNDDKGDGDDDVDNRIGVREMDRSTVYSYPTPTQRGNNTPTQSALVSFLG